MKNFLLIGALALVMAFGSSCKKEEQQQPEQKSYSVKKSKVVAGIRPDLPGTITQPDYDAYPNPADYDGIGGYPDGPMQFPHNSGACTCGKYTTCHPEPTGTITYPWGVDGPGINWPPK